MHEAYQFLHFNSLTHYHTLPRPCKQALYCLKGPARTPNLPANPDTAQRSIWIRCYRLSKRPLSSLIADGVSLRLYVLRCEEKAAHVRSLRCAIPYTQPSATHAHACRHTNYKYACMPCTFIPVVYTMPHTYALMRVGYVLHSLECLERRVVGKCRSLRAYGVGHKAVCA
jgi:hypothetical protein